MLKKHEIMRKLGLLVIISMLAGISGYGQKETWTFDQPHTNIGFSATYLGVTEVSGKFKSYSATVLSGKDDFTDAEIEISIQAASINTDNDKRDDHLSSEDFLYVEEHPEITFTSSALEKQDGKNYQMKGELTIRGVTHEETFNVVYSGIVEAMGKTRAGFKVTGSVDRFDYNIDWNKSFTKGLVVSEEIEIICDVNLVKE